MSLTWAFVALEAIGGFSCQSSKARVGIVALEDICADRRGSPVPRLYGERCDGSVATGAVGMLQHNRARRLEQRLVEGAVGAFNVAPITDGLKGAPRLRQSEHQADRTRRKANIIFLRIKSTG